MKASTAATCAPASVVSGDGLRARTMAGVLQKKAACAGRRAPERSICDQDSYCPVQCMSSSGSCCKACERREGLV